MPTQTIAKQLELNLWQDLKSAAIDPQVADLQQLWLELEQVIEQTDSSQQLRVAADAIASIVEVYVLRANAILSTLEVHDTNTDPILSEDFLNDLMRQSMSIDLSDMMEDLFPEPKLEPRPSVYTGGSFAAPVDKEVARATASVANIDTKRMLAELAGSEQVSQWAAEIAQWMHQCDGDWVSLLELQQALGLQLVEVWLGLLLFPGHQYEWERSGNFYSEAHEILLRGRQQSI
jgi:hypothetical protein